MTDCMYIMTQSELDELESRLEVYGAKVALDDAITKAVKALSEAFAQVAMSVEEAIKSFSDWWLEEMARNASEIYKPRPKPKRPQRKILSRYSPMLDKRVWIHKIKYI